MSNYDLIQNEVWREIHLWKDREGHYERLALLVPELLKQLDEAEDRALDKALERKYND